MMKAMPQEHAMYKCSKLTFNPLGEELSLHHSNVVKVNVSSVGNDLILNPPITLPNYLPSTILSVEDCKDLSLGEPPTFTSDQKSARREGLLPGAESCKEAMHTLEHEIYAGIYKIV